MDSKGINYSNKIFNLFKLYIRLLKLPELYINKILSRQRLYLIFRKKKELFNKGKTFFNPKFFIFKISKFLGKIILSMLK